MEAFFGSWKLVSCTNFDEYMEAIGKFFSYFVWEFLAISDSG